MVNLTWGFNMWNFEDKVKSNDIEEICNVLNTYKGQWVSMIRYTKGLIEMGCLSPDAQYENHSWYLKVENAEPLTDKQFNFNGKWLIFGNGGGNLFSLEQSGAGDRLIPLCLDNWEDTDETTIYTIDKKEILKFVEGQL